MLASGQLNAVKVSVPNFLRPSAAGNTPTVGVADINTSTLNNAVFARANSVHNEDARQDRRPVVAVLTAATIQNRKELDKDAALWDKRLAAGLLSGNRIRW